MFCFSCGKELDDGTKFCVYCGTKLDIPVSVAPEFTPEEPTSAVPEISAESVAPAVQEMPAEIPVQVQSQDLSQTQMSAPIQSQDLSQTQIPDSTQNQVPYQNEYQDPNQFQYQDQFQNQNQFQYQQPPVAPKKTNAALKVLIPVVAAVAVVAVVVVANFGVVSNAVMRTIKSPAEYYHWVQMKAIDDYASSFANAYADYILDTYSSKNMTVDAQGIVTIGEGASSVLSTIGASEGVDLSWIRSASAGATMGASDDQAVFNASVALNGTDIAAFNSFADLNAAMAYFSIPTISNYALTYNFADEMGYMDNEERMLYDSLQMNGDVANSLPSKAAATNLAHDFTKAYIESFQTVTVEKNYRLSANGVTEKVSAYTLYNDLLAVSTFDVTGPTALLNSSDFRDIIMSLDKSEAGRAILAEQGYSSAADYYNYITTDLQEQVERATERLDKVNQEYSRRPEIYQNLMDGVDTVTVYINNKGEIEGYYYKTGYNNQYQKIVWPHNGKSFGFEASEGYIGESFYSDSNVMASVSGSGKQSGNNVDGSFSVCAGGQELIILEVDDFNIDEAKRGYINGEFTLKPSFILASAIAEEMSVIPGVSSSISNMSLIADVSSSKNGWNVDLNLMNGGSQYLGANASVSKSNDKVSGFKPSQVLNADSSNDMYTYMESMNLDALINNLRNAGVPSMYLDELTRYWEYRY